MSSVKLGVAKPPIDVSMKGGTEDNDLGLSVAKDEEKNNLGYKRSMDTLEVKSMTRADEVVRVSWPWSRLNKKTYEEEQGCYDNDHEHHQGVPWILKL